MRHFKTLLWKELRSIIRDPKMLIAMFIVPIVLVAAIYGGMGYLMRTSFEEAKRAAGYVAVIDEDKGNWSSLFIDFLEKNASAKVYLVDNPIEAYEKYGVKVAILIPKGFSQNLTNNIPAHVKIYMIATSLSFTELGIGGRASEYVYSFADNISRTIAIKHGIPQDFIKTPIRTTPVILIASRNIEMRPEELFGTIFLLSIGTPLIALILVSMIVQFAATSMAVEKEEKMLETLLSLPVKRTTILGVKLLVPIVISLIFGGIYGFIMIYYLFYMSTAPMAEENTTGGEESVSVNITIPPEMLPYLALSLIGGIILGLIIALVLSMFVEDVRTAQMVSGYVIMPLIVALILPMFLDVSALGSSGRLAIALIPFINMAMLPKFMVLGYDYEALIASISNPIYALALLGITAKLISTERIFTAKLFQRKARRRS
ncbi:ABC transporter permease [Desulfurococcaceae archaeon MEX13E-LK6-19]|nr:ABC transporter permease [Desulfurococcaceae archaeon MEX13E-LK6-19]